MEKSNRSMLWRRLDSPGHEWAGLDRIGSRNILRGTAVFMEGGIPARLDYKITCSSRWETLSAAVSGWVNGVKVDVKIGKGADLAWQLNGKPVPGVQGCMDIDLSFSPSTNLLPIRRMGLGVGEEAEVRAAWLTFPELGLHPLVQWFKRESGSRYAYRADTGFAAELIVNEAGFVEDYPPLWIEEKGPETFPRRPK